MPIYPFVTADVFTDRQFGGNPLAVVTDARGLSTNQMQSLAAEFNLSETVFVLPPENPENTARVRIFNRVEEMPFAGHPNVGTGFVLAALGKARGDTLVLEQPAGPVKISVSRDVRSEPSLVTIAAPQPLSVGPEINMDMIGACIGLDATDIVTSAHRPVVASVGISFVIAEVTLSALARAKADASLFQNAVDTRPELEGRLFLHIYAREDGRIRARMFAPLAGMPEDPATGSANAALGALLLSLGTQGTSSYRVVQGLEMGRPSLMQVSASHAPDGFRAKVGGGCKMVLRGEVMIEDGIRVPGDGGHWGPM